MTLGNAAAARVRLIVWCLDCRHQVEPDPAEMVERHGAETSVRDWSGSIWRKRPVQARHRCPALGQTSAIMERRRIDSSRTHGDNGVTSG
jgi:hypothetical protein